MFNSNKSFLERQLDKYKTKKRNQVIKNSLLGKKKDIRLLTKGIKQEIHDRAKDLPNKLNISASNIKSTIDNKLDKQASITKLAALEAASRQAQKIETTKRIFIKPFQRLKDGKQHKVEGFWKNVRNVVESPIHIGDEGLMNNLKLTPGFINKSANLTKIVESNGSKYVLKASNPQIASTKLKNLLGFNYDRSFNMPVNEALSSEMGKKLGVNIQNTILIPSGTKHKFGDNSIPWTLHKFVKGIPLKDAIDKGVLDKKFNVSLKLAPKDDTRIGEYFSWDKKVKMVSQHKDLSKIFALDLITSNYDNHTENIFYDKGSNSFTAVDRGESFLFPVDFSGLKSAINSSYKKLNGSEKRNINEFKNTLDRATKNYNPERLNSKLDFYLDQAMGNSKLDPLTKEQIKLNHEKKKIIYKMNYDNAKDYVKWHDKYYGN